MVSSIVNITASCHNLKYGQAVRFKAEFDFLRPKTIERCAGGMFPQKGKVKPTMGQMEAFSPEVKRLYLSK